MKTYMIRINTINNLYADYMVEAESLHSARYQARKAFFRDYPDADKNIKLELQKPDTEKIKEIIDIIKGEL